MSTRNYRFLGVLAVIAAFLLMWWIMRPADNPVPVAGKAKSVVSITVFDHEQTPDEALQDAMDIAVKLDRKINLMYLEKNKAVSLTVDPAESLGTARKRFSDALK